MMKREHWKLDKRIPIAVILTLFIQMVGAVIWATELDARVSSMERQAPDSSLTNEKLARVEERLVAIKENVDSIKNKMDHLTNFVMKK